MESIALFKKSYSVLQDFFERWLVCIGERCKEDDRKKAGYYVWARYSMSMRTLDSLLDPHLIPDLSVICRGCIEFNVTIDVVSGDSNAARDYLDFEKHAEAHYLRHLSKHGDFEHFMSRREDFTEKHGDNPEEYRRTSWCAKLGGITGLLTRTNRKHDLLLYNMLSHFAHGSVWAMKMLDGKVSDPERMLARMIDKTYTSYLDSSRRFIWSVWEPLVTPEGESCKAHFLEVMTSHVQS